MKRLFLILAASIGIAIQANAATVVSWSAAFDAGFSAFDGSPLPVGNEVRLGHFNISDLEIAGFISRNDLAGLNSRFVTFGTATIGVGPNVTPETPSNRRGLFEQTTAGDTDALLIANTQAYLWVFKTSTDTAVLPTFGNVTQTGVFYRSFASDGDWKFFGTNDIGNTASLELSDLTTVPNGSTNLSNGAVIVAGSFPKGTIPGTGGGPGFGLVVVPEPSSFLLLSIGAIGLGLRRRRN